MVHNEYLSTGRTKCPQVHTHVESFSLPWALVASKWFVCAFADVLPVETTLRLWDCLFAEGSKILLRAAVALVIDPDNKKKILGCGDFADLAVLFKSMTVGGKTTMCHEFVSVRNRKHDNLITFQKWVKIPQDKIPPTFFPLPGTPLLILS